MAFAIIEAGGKQHKVSPEQKLKIEKVKGDKGAILNFDKVLLVVAQTDADGTQNNAEKSVRIGTPYVEGAKVEAEILRQARDKKIIVFRYHSKTRSRKKKGHRQEFTEIKIIAIK